MTDIRQQQHGLDEEHANGLTRFDRADPRADQRADDDHRPQPRDPRAQEAQRAAAGVHPVFRSDRQDKATEQKKEVDEQIAAAKQAQTGGSELGMIQYNRNGSKQPQSIEQGKAVVRIHYIG